MDSLCTHQISTITISGLPCSCDKRLIIFMQINVHTAASRVLEVKFTQTQSSCKKRVRPSKAWVKKVVKSKVAAMKWLIINFILMHSHY